MLLLRAIIVGDGAFIGDGAVLGVSGLLTDRSLGVVAFGSKGEKGSTGLYSEYFSAA